MNATLKNIDCPTAFLLAHIAQQYKATKRPVELKPKLLRMLPKLILHRLLVNNVIVKKVSPQPLTPQTMVKKLKKSLSEMHF